MRYFGLEIIDAMKTMRNLYDPLIALVLLVSCQSNSGEIFTTNDGAIGGYDPVAYFKEGQPAKGEKQFATTWNEAQWYFSSQENLDAFKADPEKYAPQYGGYCAYGTSRGYKAATQPDAWTIVDDKLYLNYNVDVRTEWMKNKEMLIHKADSNWSYVRQTEFK